MSRPARYGVDAPPAFLGLLVGAVVGIVLTAVAFVLGWWIAWVLLLSTLYTVASGSLYSHTTLRGKQRVWDEVLNALRLTGTEEILDLGCGRGMVLIAAARRLPNGRATGVDLWRARDQSGNTRDAAMHNAVAEGVADRTDLVTADIRTLPFEDRRFDVVLSSLAVHNIPDQDGRDRAIAEAYRVLAPGGRLRVADMRHTGRYAEILRSLGAETVQAQDLGWRFWYGGPWFGTRMVTAAKPTESRSRAGGQRRAVGGD